MAFAFACFPQKKKKKERKKNAQGNTDTMCFFLWF
jgi:hypothetical protein